MQRLACYDCINQPRLDIIQVLSERELDLGEICRLLKTKRNVTHYHIRILVKFGLVTQKKSLKQNIYGGPRSHREILHYELTGNGRDAIKFYKFERGE